MSSPNESPTVTEMINGYDSLRREHARLVQAIGENMPVWCLVWFDPLREEIFRWSNFDHDPATVKGLLVKAAEDMPIDIDGNHA